MKKKILSIILIFTIVLSSSISSFANENDIVIQNYKAKSAITTLGGYVITKETFNIIVGVASACGVALLTESDCFDFVQNTINTYARKYEKVDSGDFLTSKQIIENLETEIKNGSSKDPKEPNKLIVGSSLVSFFMSIFNLMQEDENNDILVGSSIPIYPNYTSIPYGNVDVKIWYSTKNGNRFYVTRRDSTKLAFSLPDTKEEQTLLIANSLPRLSYIPCKSGSNSCKSSNCEYLSQPNYYHVRVWDGESSVSVFLRDLTNSNKYYVSCYIPTKKYMSTYNPIKKDLNVNNLDVPTSTNPNIYVNGSIELPNNSLNNNNELPSYPSLEDIDFNGFDFSSLGSLFENFKNKFPFSLPFDLHNILSSFSVDPQAPIFEVPLFSESITIDLTQFNELANIIRMFVVIGWVVGLFILTKTFGG